MHLLEKKQGLINNLGFQFEEVREKKVKSVSRGMETIKINIENNKLLTGKTIEKNH